MLHRILTAIAAVAAVLLLWALAALFWALVGVGCVLLAVIAVMAAGLRRRLAGRPAAAGTWRADVLREPAPQVTVISYHLAPGTDLSRLSLALPHGSAASTEEEREMRLFSSRTPEQKAERKAAVARLDAAEDALWENGRREKKAGIREETDEYHRLNDAVWDALEDPALPWWKRGRSR